MKLNQDLALKIAKFKSDSRARISLAFLLIAFFITLPAEFLCNIRPILLIVNGKIYFPIIFTYSEMDFGGKLPSEPDYKSDAFINLLNGIEVDYPKLSKSENTNQGSDLALSLKDFEDDNEKSYENPGMVLNLHDFEEESLIENEMIAKSSEKNMQIHAKNFWTLWPPIRYDYKYIPTTSRSGIIALASPYRSNSPINKSSWLDGHYLGTDDRGRDVLARLIYGFRISLIFGLSLAITGTIFGSIIGGVQGFFGGWIDLIGQRLTEIWGSLPRLYFLIILSSFLTPSAWLLFIILNLTAWMGIAAYIRAEFLKSRNLEYVKAAKAMGVSNIEIMWRHILPNSLTPVITFFPFEVTAGILALVSLDFLNLGVPSPAPSIGELLSQGKNNLQATWILLPTFIVLTGTLTVLTFIGEGIRNAFDPKKSIKTN